MHREIVIVKENIVERNVILPENERKQILYHYKINNKIARVLNLFLSVNVLISIRVYICWKREIMLHEYLHYT